MLVTHMDANETEKLSHVAGALCLELANTIPNRRVDSDRDWLVDPGIPVWALSAGLPRVARPAHTEREDLTRLRGAVHRVFAAVAQGSDPPAADVDALTSLHAEGLRAYGYAVSGDGHVERRWPVSASSGDRMARISTSAVELLTGEDLARVRECAGCGWLFVDASRNRSRVWCSMETCGNRSKARRHHDRVRESPVPKVAADTM